MARRRDLPDPPVTRALTPLWLCAALLALGAACSGSRSDNLGRELETSRRDAAAEAGEICLDEDGDGHGAGCAPGRDCDDADANRALGLDAFHDRDGDHYGDEPAYVCPGEDGELPPGYALESGDCDDDDAKVNPGVAIDGCDEIDIDCDDKIDEDRTPLPTTCGSGVCQGTGESRCTDDGVVDSCANGESTGNDEDCNGRDDDCDGVVDDGFRATPSTCMRDGCSATGMVQCINGAVVDDCHAPTRAASDSTCDGLDDDCDGQVDEDFAPQSTACGAGTCAAGGQTSCRDGHVSDSCMAGSGMGEDDDCNGIDDDCNGVPDDGFVQIDSNCGAGACRATGRISCLSGRRVDSCMGSLPGGSDTTCDGIDDDCSGQVDEDYRGPSRSCGTGACQRSAPDVCVSGRVQSACMGGMGAASDATCNGVDEDCSGAADEDFVERASSCGVGACARTGTVRCASGAETNSCTAGAASGTDNDCDGVDDDCDGQVDEAYVATRTTCGAGACAANGFLRCVSGATVDTCTESAPGGRDAVCDGVDSDCDGRPDDDYAPRSVTCGVGACRRTVQTSCQGGTEIGCTPGPTTGTDNDCDGVDDDCDGSTDEDYAGAATSCGVGACARSGRRSCVSGAVVDSCSAGPPAPADNNCDNVDDDCNGTADEDYSVPTACGVGACRRTGTQTCRSGQPVNNCTPGTPAASDTTCNSVDEDCSGVADEDYPSQTTSCGTGVCARTGRSMCVGGQPVSSCVAGAATGADTDCNGLDDDCDGVADDGFRASATTCGVGECGARGTLSCVSGRPSNSCVPVPAPSSTDTTCDGRDDDCSGAADEDYGTQASSCGVGQCVTQGSRTCQSGAVVDTCSPRANVCAAAARSFCSSGQECTGNMTCTSVACGCAAPTCTMFPPTRGPQCMPNGQSCGGTSVCGACLCSAVPSCNATQRVCRNNAAGALESCGSLGCTTCDCRAPSCDTTRRMCSDGRSCGVNECSGAVCSCQACTNGCNAATGSCNLDIRQITNPLTTQTVGQLTTQTIGTPSQTAVINGAAGETGTTSLFTDFFRDTLGISEE